MLIRRRHNTPPTRAQSSDTHLVPDGITSVSQCITLYHTVSYCGTQWHKDESSGRQGPREQAVLLSCDLPHHVLNIAKGGGFSCSLAGTSFPRGYARGCKCVSHAYQQCIRCVSMCIIVYHICINIISHMYLSITTQCITTSMIHSDTH